MSVAILQEYQTKFPMCCQLLQSFNNFFAKKLWNELTNAVLKFIYHPESKGKVSFQLYTEFVSKFQKNIDQINLFKILKECLTSLSNSEILEFLSNFELKEAANEESKAIIQAFQAYYYVPTDIKKSSEIIQKLKTYIDTKKDVDSFLYSSYYRVCTAFYKSKGKYKQFYTSALQFLAYTPSEEIEEIEKLNLLNEMARAVLLSDEIYNFSQLLEQPLLVTLQNSEYCWVYNFLQIFNKGDILGYDKMISQHKELSTGDNVQKLQQKIRLMSFLELAFNLPKNDRVITFSKLAEVCSIPFQHVEFMIMKAMALKLVKGSINQLAQKVTLTWVAPKVLENERVGVMLEKFQSWEGDIKNVQNLIKGIKAY